MPNESENDRQNAAVALDAGPDIATVASLITLVMLLVAGGFGLLHWLPGWPAAMIVIGFTLLMALIGAVVGWRKRAASRSSAP
jgi:hypothetical protein